IRVPTRSAGTRSGVNCRRLNDPPSTSATVLMVSVLARPGTPSRSTCPPASRATSTRSSIASWPTMTRLISKSAASRASWAARAGRSSCSSSARRRRSSEVTRWSPVPRLRGRRTLRLVPKCHREGTPFAAALDHQVDLVARSVPVHDAREVVRLAHRLVAGLDDAVARAHAGALGRAAGDDVLHGRAAVGRERARDAEVGALDVLALDERRDDLLDLVDRHGEADAGVAAALTGDLRVHADHAALAVEQRAAGVARVDRGVGLHGVGDREAVGRLDRAPERRDDAARDRALEPERAADADRGVAGAEVARGAQLERLHAALDLRRVDLEHGEVGRRVLAEQLGVDGLAVLAEAHAELVRALDDVVVGDDVALVVDDEARARRGAAAAREGQLPAAGVGLDEDDAGLDLAVDVRHGGGLPGSLLCLLGPGLRRGVVALENARKRERPEDDDDAGRD